MPELRYIVIGLGAIGGTLAGMLHSAGREIIGVARPGPHLDAIRANGLLVRRPEGDRTVRLDVRESVDCIATTPDDVVVLAVKTQDTASLLVELSRTESPLAHVVCAQNGVTNESEALRLFENVYGAVVQCPALHLEPGVVVAYSSPTVGMLDVGPFPSGGSAVAERIVADLRASGYSSNAVDDIARWKYAKLLSNLGNAVEVVCGPTARNGALTAMLQAEGRALFDERGIGYVSTDELARRQRGVLTRYDVGGSRPGGSVWQSVTRAQPTEVDYLCGEIVRLARVAGLRAPANALLQRLTHEVASGELAVGVVPEASVIGQLAAHETVGTNG